MVIVVPVKVLADAPILLNSGMASFSDILLPVTSFILFGASLFIQEIFAPNTSNISTIDLLPWLWTQRTVYYRIRTVSSCDDTNYATVSILV